MIEHHILSLGLILILGGGAQWVAWRLHLPSILILMILGFLAGPVFGVIHPDALFGDSLFPFISLSVAILLFEGGLSLKFKHIEGHGKLVRNLISVGIVVSWLVTSVLAHYMLSFEWSTSLLLGAVLSVSGPTVVVPLLRHIRPAAHIGSVLRWEGILIDSIGALLAILVFGFVVQGAGGGGILLAGLAIVKTIFFGTIIGVIGAGVIVIALKRFWVPDYLHITLSLMAVVCAYIASNELQPESGLLAVTVMGIALINQHFVSIEHIVEFKENLGVLLIGSLFIILSARLHLSDLAFVDGKLIAFVAVLILVVRPLVVAVSSRKIKMPIKEKIFLSAMYPRGIVAVAVASIFSLGLAEAGHPAADVLAPITVLVVAGTVAVYGLFSLPLARLLGVAKPNPDGVLFIGADDWVRDFAKVLKDEGVAVSLVDEHWSDVKAAREDGLEAYHAKSFHEHMSDEIELGDMGHIVALSSSDELNALVTSHYYNVFDSKHIYQLPFDQPQDVPLDAQDPYLVGRPLFDKQATFNAMSKLFYAGGMMDVMKVDADFNLEEFYREHGDDSVLLCTVGEGGKVNFYIAGQIPKPIIGDKLVYIAAHK